MQNCHFNDDINNDSYQRIKGLVCDTVKPYQENNYTSSKVNYNIFIIFFLLFLLVAFYKFFSFAPVEKKI